MPGMTDPPKPEDLLSEYDPDAAAPSLAGWERRVADILAIGIALYALYWVVAVIPAQMYRFRFLLGCLTLTFLSYPFSRGRHRTRVPIGDWLLILLSTVVIVWPLIDFDRFIYRAAEPSAVDVAMGTVLILLVLEATRRSAGWILPVTTVGFLAYAWLGPLLDLVGLEVIAHRGYGLDRLVGTLYMSLEGIFGVPLDVASTYIILFTIFGAVLEHSGAGRFFLEWSRAAIGRAPSGAAPGRSVTLAGLLLGTVSGSGVATTVMLGSVSAPMLRQAGYPPPVAGGVLAAAGIGAILCPPALGAAAFLIAEFLKISYLQVILMATIPALLYYLSAFLMIGADAKRLGARPVAAAGPSVWALTRQHGYHFISLVTVGAFLLSGMTAFRAVFWATLLAVAVSFVRRDTALLPRRLFGALAAGGRGVLSVAATTATAGIIVGIVTLTGLGLKAAGLIVTLAGGQVFATVVLAALAVWTLGLAVPVTASYIIGAVMVAPAMVQVGIAPVAAHMFIFYYAVLSEVSPPTALAPFAAAALTGGHPFKTMMVTWKYTLPAFLVPFVFTLDPSGLGVLMQAPILGIVRSVVTAACGVGALALAFGGWYRGPVALPPRVVAGMGGVLLFYPSVPTDVAGLALLAGALAWHLRQRWYARG